MTKNCENCKHRGKRAGKYTSCKIWQAYFQPERRCAHYEEIAGRGGNETDANDNEPDNNKNDARKADK
jgi:hypothetical protein